MREMRRSLPIAVALSALLLATPPAHAGKIADTQSYGPIVLAGNAVLYSVNRQSSQAARVRLARPGHVSKPHLQPAAVSRISRGADSYQGGGLLPAGRRPGLPGTRRHREQQLLDHQRALDGPPDRSAQARHHHVAERNPCLGKPLAVAVGDDALVTIEGTCSSQRVVVVRDYARRGTPASSPAPQIKALAAAGHFVAWVERNRRVQPPTGP